MAIERRRIIDPMVFMIRSLIRKYINKIRLLRRKIGTEAVFPDYIIKKNLRFKQILKTESSEVLVVKSTLELVVYPPSPITSCIAVVFVRV
jgi:hypothetical protein